jgi:hypothetical protein
MTWVRFVPLFLAVLAFISPNWGLSNALPTYARPLIIPAIVYVDNNWTGLAAGTVVDADPGPGRFVAQECPASGRDTASS